MQHQISMMRKIVFIAPALALVAALVVLVASRGETQGAPDRLIIGIYAPTVEFGTAQNRLAYVQGLARAIESNTGIQTTAASFASLGALRKGNVDFAIVDGQCYSTNLGWRLLANAQVGGGTSRNWALYSSVGPDMQGLRGKKLAFVQMGCNDGGFIDNAMLESEVDTSFFSSRVGKPDLTAAVAEVASYKGAQAVFAPVGAQKGLTKVFDTGAVPNPAFVQLNGKLSGSVADKVSNAVVGYGGSGAISGWAGANKGNYQGLAGRMGRVVKRGIFAAPEPVRVEAKDVLIEPESLRDTALTEVRQHFERPPERME
jgi:hypothetical protein